MVVAATTAVATGAANPPTATVSSTTTALPRQCGPVNPDEPTRTVCPRGWSVCLTAKSNGSTALAGAGYGELMPTRIWHDANRDGVADREARYTYDQFGNVLTVWLDEFGNGIVNFEARNTYDARGLLVARWSDNYYDSSPSVGERYRYNADGWLVHKESLYGDQVQNQQDFTYAAAGSLPLAKDPDGTQYAYNAAGKVVREWRKSWKKEYTYDAQQRVVHILTEGTPGPVQYEEHNVYDAAGNVIKQTTSTGPGSKTRTEHKEYDVANRVTRRWDDYNDDGKPESDKRTTYNLQGEILSQREDRDGNGKIDFAFGREFNASGQLTRAWLDTNGDGKNESDMFAKYDTQGNKVQQRTLEQGRMTADVRWEYANGKLVRWWMPTRPTEGSRLQYDAAGNRIVEDNGPRGVIHYEYDLAASAAINARAPAACTAASWPDGAPERVAMQRDPQPVGIGLSRDMPTTEFLLVAAKPITAPALPKLDRQGFVVGADGSSIAAGYNGYIAALIENEYVARGWRRVPLHSIGSATPGQLVRGLLVEKNAKQCGKPATYLTDGQSNVFRANVGVSCSRTVVVKIHGSLPTDGCGREPPPTNLYAEVPDGAKLQQPAPAAAITVPVCWKLQPDQGFAGPP